MLPTIGTGIKMPIRSAVTDDHNTDKSTGSSSSSDDYSMV